MPPRMHPFARSVILGGAIAGTLDIIYAIVFHGMRGAHPSRVLQSIASGLLGSEAFTGGLTTAAIGLCAHYFIAASFAAVFAFAALRIHALLRHAALAGMAYGFCAFWVMNLVVLPLSAVPFKVTFATLPTILGVLVHMVLIGLPIALVTKRMMREKAAEPGATDNPDDAQRLREDH